MASERDQMNSKAQQYINKVKSAKQACNDAKSSISAAQSVISISWQSDAGQALVDALADACSRLERVSSSLATAQSMMAAEAQAIYNNWPEEGE